MRRFLAFAGVLFCTPVLQGAGCTAHYWPRIHGKLRADPGADQGKPLVVVYRKHEPGIRVCTKDWTPCLQSGWHTLRRCKSEDGKRPSLTVTLSSEEVYDFEGCTDMLGVHYRADIAAFIDANGNERLDSGERYGVYEGSPLSRDMEASALPLTIEITEVMP